VLPRSVIPPARSLALGTDAIAVSGIPASRIYRGEYIAGLGGTTTPITDGLREVLDA
jgi:hypothetical protein